MSKCADDCGGPARLLDTEDTLRDWFAGYAMTGLLAVPNGPQSGPDMYARDAYMVADAMLVERAREMPPDVVTSQSNTIATLRKDRDALAEQVDVLRIEKGNAVLAYEQQQEQLAGYQAYSALLRELLPHNLPGGFIGLGKYYAEQPSKFAPLDDPMSKYKRKWFADCQDTLALPTDDTALRERLAAERERCAKVCEDHPDNLGAGHSFAAAIRSLP